MEVFTVLHRFLLESGGFRSIPGIPGEWNFGSGACKIIMSFQRNADPEFSRITGMEWHPELTGKESGEVCNEIFMY